MSNNWNDEKRKHALEQIKYLLTDWLKTNNPNLQFSQNSFDNTCNCILERVVIPNYEYKDGIEYIQWTSLDNEKIISCIDSILVNTPPPVESTEIQDEQNKSRNIESFNIYYILLVIIILILIIGFCVYVYNKSSTEEHDEL